MNLTSFLHTTPSFKIFSHADLETLAKAMRVEDFPAGHILIQQGARGKDLFVLVEGEVEVRRFDRLTGSEETLKNLGPGELFGLLSLIDRMPAAASCFARTPVKVASLPRTAYDLLTGAAAPIAYHFQWLVAQQLARDLLDRTNGLRQLLLTI